MSNLITTEEFGTLNKRDVTEEFITLIKNKPTFLSLVPYLNNEASRVRSHKHEWLNDSQTQRSWAVDGASNTGSTSITFDSTTGLRVGDILRFTASTGASISVKCRIITINANGTDATIERLGTDANITDDAVATLISRPHAEMSNEEFTTNRAPTQAYNYTQIFREDFALSRTNLQSSKYGFGMEANIRERIINDFINYQAISHLNNISWELNNTIIHGYREERSAASDHRGTAGGVLFYHEQQAETLLNAAGAAISATVINNSIDQAVKNGANNNELSLILCHSTQARKISAFNDSIAQTVRGDRTAGRYIVQFESDLSGTNGGALTTIVVDNNYPEDKISILPSSGISIKPMEPISLIETTEGKTDGRTWRILGELTFEYLNYNINGITVYGLSL